MSSISFTDLGMLSMCEGGLMVQSGVTLLSLGLMDVSQSKETTNVPLVSHGSKCVDDVYPLVGLVFLYAFFS